MTLTSSSAQVGVAPTLIKISPDYYSGRATVGVNIVLTFSEAIIPGSGSITISDSAGRIVVQESINSARVTISGSTVILDPVADFDYASDYSIVVPLGLVKDLDGNEYQGYGSPTTFQTDFSPVAVNLSGTAGDDTLYGSDLNDVINGGSGGRDRLHGRGGDDILNGGDEDDNFASDYLYGEDGNDTMHGNVGGDVLSGGNGNDKLYGDAGADTLDGGAGDDVLEGGVGNDNLSDTSGNNVLRGGDGNDTLESGYSSFDVRSVMDGGAGDDYVKASGNDTVDGGDGNDHILVSVSASTANASTLAGGAGNDRFQVQFYGSTQTAVHASGGAGIDTYVLETGMGTTSFTYEIADFAPGAGGDLIDLAQVFIRMSSSTGNPFSAQGYLRLQQDGADTLLQMHVPGAAASEYSNLVRLAGVAPDQLTGANFVGGIDPKGGAQGLTLNGTEGADTLRGNSMNDQLYGKGGADLLAGNAGDDLLVGGDESAQDGADSLYGGDDNDILQGGAGNDTLDGDAGNDTLEGASGDDLLNDLYGKNTLLGGAGNDTLSSSAEGGSTLDGGDGNDILRGGYGSDVLSGGAGNDKITVNAFTWIQNHAVQVNGGAGDDQIELAMNNNAIASVRVSGGTGKDLFMYTSPYIGEVNITDFSSLDGDIIDLRAIFPADTGGNPFGASGFLRAEQYGNNVAILFDPDGAAGTARGMQLLFRMENVSLASLGAASFAGGWDPSGAATGVTLTGTAGDDKLAGGSLNDKLSGGDGADHLVGGAGDDVLDGGDETRTGTGDVLEGGYGNDTLFGRTGNDELRGQQGDDSLDGGAGIDKLDGGEGNDTLDGGDGNDTLSDDAGNNILRGGGGDDSLHSPGSATSTLDGGDGDDHFYVGAGNDSLIGGAGNDTFDLTGNDIYGATPNAITVSGGDGNDVFNYRSGPVKTTVLASGGAGSDTFRISVTSTDGLLTISDFTPGVGGDVLDLMGMLNYNYQGSNPFGQPGLFRLVQSGTDTVLEYDSDGAVSSAYGFKPLAVLSGVAMTAVGAANFTQGMNPNGTAEGLTLIGSGGADGLTGGFLNDTLRGGEGDDSLTGGAGDDLLDGGAGADGLRGDSGNDILLGGDGNDSLIGDEGDDRLEGGNGDDTLGDSDSAGSNTLLGGDGKDSMHTNGTGKNLLDGGADDDSLAAGNGNDTLLGGAGADTLQIYSSTYGSTAAHTVTANGGDGDDVISARLAVDRPTQLLATGGAGIDTYVMNAVLVASTYMVTDFSADEGGDRINVLNLLPSTYEDGNPFGAAALLRLVQRGNDTVLQFDTDGPGGPKQFQDLVSLQGVQATSLTAANFTGSIAPNGDSTGITLNGGEQKDTLRGAFLNDVLIGNGGNDYLEGNGGDDRIDGGVGDDSLSGGSGNDQLTGGAGNDGLNGGKGDDKLDGGDGDDVLSDEYGSNTFNGGEGNDHLSSYGSGHDLLHGGGGNDSLSGGVGADLLDGGAGDDLLSIYAYSTSKLAAHDVILNGGLGNDSFKVWADSLAGMNVMATGGAGKDTFVLSALESGNTYTVLDFDTALNGDVISLASLLSGAGVYTQTGNPFASGYVHLLQSGADTLLQFDADSASSSVHSLRMVVTLKGVNAATLTARHFAEYVDPLGSLTGAAQSGDEAANTITGGWINDSLLGNSGNDRLYGNAGDDLLDGGDGSDFLEGGRGDDLLKGGSGTDSASYAGNIASYIVTKSAAGITVSDKNGTDGLDTLSGVERLIFRDVAMAFDAVGSSSQVYRLYRAAFDRVPDSGGLGYWIEMADRGTMLKEIATSFVASTEFAKLYGAAPTNADIVHRMYLNVLHREPDAGGQAYWTDILDRGASSVGDVLAGFSESAENTAAVAQIIGQGFSYTPYH
jgi:Ca2+-binding RTX toxin-like protein